jgi:three-Cys-motif partner protein
MPTTSPENFFAAIREWQWIKHLVLSTYLWPWSMKVGSRALEIFVVDAFAGAGTYRAPSGETREGSPVIAARRARQYQAARPAAKMRVICVERNTVNYRKLQARMAQFGDLVSTIPGDFHDHVSEILNTIGQAPAVILLDPIGLKAITANRCRELLQRAGKTDLFVIVHFGIVHRAAGQLLPDGSADPRIAAAAATTRNVDEFFGTPDWRRIALDPTLVDRIDKEPAYLRLYWRSVLGGRYRFKSGYEVRAELDGPVKYWLVHASDHEDAFWLMNDAVYKVDQLLIQQKYQRPAELPGIAESLAGTALEDVARSRAESLQRETITALEDAGGTLIFNDLKWRLTERYFGKVTQGAYSKAVRELVKARRVQREERTGAAFRDTERIRLATPGGASRPPQPPQMQAPKREQLAFVF